MQTQNRLFDDLARVAGGALGAMSGLREELELLVRTRLERALSDMDLVTREEFDVVKAMAQEARSENAALLARIEALEAQQDSSKPAPKATKASKASAAKDSDETADKPAK